MMNRITLKSIEVKSFRGLTVTFAIGDDITKIFGRNMTGKSRIMDAYFWLLIGKSHDGKQNDVQTRDSDNKVIPMLVTSVSAVFCENGADDFTLTREWVQKLNDDNIIIGNTGNCYVNSVKKKESDFKDFIAEHFGLNEQSLYILSNPRYFIEILDEKSRRKFLIDLVGDVSDADVAATDKDFKDIAERLKFSSLDELRQEYKNGITELNKQIDMYPVAINAKRELVREVSSSENDIRKNIAELSDEISRIPYGKTQDSPMAAMINEKNGLINRKNILIKKHQDQLDEQYEVAMKEKEAKRDGYVNLRNRLYELETKKNDLTKAENSLRSEIERKRIEINGLRERFQVDRLSAMSLRNGGDEPIMCPLHEGFVCKNAELATIIDSEREGKIKSIVSGMEALNEKAATMLEEIKVKEAEITQKGKELGEISKECDDVNKELSDKSKITEQFIQRAVANEYNTDGVAEISKDIMAIEAKMRQIESDNASELESANEKAKSLNIKRDGLLAELGVIESNARIMSEIKAIEEKRDGSVMARSELTRLYDLVKSFKHRKMEMIESRVNGMFGNGITIKMFEQNMDGTEKDREICVVLVNGKEYLSNAQVINTGLAMIDAFGTKKGLSLPIFVDNSESINELRHSNGQTIALYVDDSETLHIN